MRSKMEAVKKVPMPLCGVMLGVAALGNLFQDHWNGIRFACGITAGALLILILLKTLFFFKEVKEDMKDPVMASVSGTFSMALMILSAYMRPFIGRAAFYIWIIAIMLHSILIVYFTVRFVLKLQMTKVFASYYIVYVGIAAAAITAPIYGQHRIGGVTFWFGLISLAVWFVFITIRYVGYKEIQESARPLICIYAAPANLCIAGYIQSVPSKSYEFLMGMYIIACMMYIFALIKAIEYLRLPFYPSYASFTFPFVISAVASKQTMACLMKMGHPMPVLRYVAFGETIVAVVLVVYTLISFFDFLFIKK